MANTSLQAVSKTLQVPENGTAVFVCEVPPSWPPAQVYWEKGGERVDHEADNRMWLLPSGNLYIIGVRRLDEGHYKCSATNPVTDATRHSKVLYQLTVATGVSGSGLLWYGISEAVSYDYNTLSRRTCL